MGKIIAESRWRADIPLDREGAVAQHDPVLA